MSLFLYFTDGQNHLPLYPMVWLHTQKPKQPFSLLAVSETLPKVPLPSVIFNDWKHHKCYAFNFHAAFRLNYRHN